MVKLNKNSFKNEIVRGISYSIVGSIVAQGIMFLSNIPLSNMLGSKMYGGFGLIQNNIFLITQLAGSLLSIPAQKFVSQYKTDSISRLHVVVKKSLKFGIIFSIIFGVSYAIYDYSFATSNMAPLSLTLGIIVFINAYNSAQIGVLAGLGKFDQVSFSNIIKGLSSSVLMILFAYVFALTGSVIGLLVGSLFSCLFCLRVINRYFINQDIPQSEYIPLNFNYKTLLGFGLPSVFASLITIPAMIYANTKLSIQDNDQSSMALYNIGFQWRALILFVPTYVNFNFLSQLSSSYHTDFARFRKMLLINFFVTFSVCGFFIILIFLSKDLIEGIYSTDFIGVYEVIKLLSLSAIFSVITSVIGNAFVAMGRMWTGFFTNLTWALIFIYFVTSVDSLSAIDLSFIYIKSYILLLFLSAVLLLLILKSSNHKKVQNEL